MYISVYTYTNTYTCVCVSVSVCIPACASYVHVYMHLYGMHNCLYLYMYPRIGVPVVFKAAMSRSTHFARDADPPRASVSQLLGQAALAPHPRSEGAPWWVGGVHGGPFRGCLMQWSNRRQFPAVAATAVDGLIVSCGSAYGCLVLHTKLYGRASPRPIPLQSCNVHGSTCCTCSGIEA